MVASFVDFSLTSCELLLKNKPGTAEFLSFLVIEFQFIVVLSHLTVMEKVKVGDIVTVSDKSVPSTVSQLPLLKLGELMRGDGSPNSVESRTPDH